MTSQGTPISERPPIVCVSASDLGNVSRELRTRAYGDWTVDCSALRAGREPLSLELRDITAAPSPDARTWRSAGVSGFRRRRRRTHTQAADYTRSTGRLNLTIIVPSDHTFSIAISRAELGNLAIESKAGVDGAIDQVVIEDSMLRALRTASLSARRLWIRECRIDTHLTLAAARINGECRIEHVTAGREFSCPRTCGHLFIRRCRLDGIEASGTSVTGLAAVERVTLSDGGLAVHGSSFMRGFSLTNCDVGGPVRVSRTRLPYLVLEDCELRDRVRVRLQPERQLSAAGETEWSSTVSLSRSVFHGPFLLGEELGPTRGSAHDDVPHTMRVFAASARFDKPTTIQCGKYRDPTQHRPTWDDEAPEADERLGRERMRAGHLLLQRCWFGGDLEVDVFGNSALADLAGSRVADGEMRLQGKEGTPSIICLDSVVTPVLRIQGFSLQECRLDRLHAVTLKLSSDIRFDRPRRRHVWFPLTPLRLLRHPLAREVFDERLTRARDLVEHDDGWRLADADPSRTRPPKATWTKVWLDSEVDTEVPLQRTRLYALPGTGWEGLSPLRRGLPCQTAYRASVQHDSRARATLQETETLARIYGQLASAFDDQGDMTLANDFAWQHLRWRRKFVGQLTQYDRNRKYTELLEELRDGESKSWGTRVLMGVRGAQLHLARRPFGGTSGSHLALRSYQLVAGSGSRSRSVLASTAVITLLMTGLAALVASSISIGAEATSAALIPTVRLPASAGAENLGFFRIFHGVGHVVGTLLIAALLWTLRSKVRVRSHSRL